MDPNAVLDQIRTNAKAFWEEDGENDIEALTELVSAIEDLDEWLTSGGFLPSAWTNTSPTD